MQSFNEFIKTVNNDFGDRVLHFGNWLEDIYYEHKNETLNIDYFIEEPNWLDLPDRQIIVYTASAHQLAIELGLNIPKWVFKDKYFSRKPIFPEQVKGDRLKIELMYQSPKAFRIRNVFFSANTLVRV